jgi:hypothetical protein
MNRKLCLVLAVGAVIALDARILPPPVAPAWAACEKGDKLDKTTATETRQKLAKTGYTKIRDLRKGCDNTWHAKATKAGTEESVAVLPDGTVVKEGD